MLVELVRWLTFILPGLIYSIWRYNSRRTVCANCGWGEQIPVDSPVARAQRAQLMREPSKAT